MNNILDAYIENPRDAELNFGMAVYYLSIQHYAGAVTHFLRCAEYGDIENDKDLIYESLIHISLCFQILGNRAYSEEGWLLHAISLCPNRPEAYWLLSILYERQNKWQECYAMTCIGLMNVTNLFEKLRLNVGYEGEYVLRFQKMVASYHIRPKETPGLLKELYEDSQVLSEKYNDLVLKNMQNLKIVIPKNFKHEVDVVIISWAKTEELRSITKRALDSLFISETEVFFRVCVVESNKTINYNEYNGKSKIFEVNTVYTDEPFGYNKYLNIGIAYGKSEYVVLCNNDIIFNKNWASIIVEAMINNPEILSACPANAYMDCIFQRRKIYDVIGKLDESVTFHYSDDIYAVQLLLNNITHYGIEGSSITHKQHSGVTIYSLYEPNSNEFYELTEKQKPVYEKRVIELVQEMISKRTPDNAKQYYQLKSAK